MHTTKSIALLVCAMQIHPRAFRLHPPPRRPMPLASNPSSGAPPESWPERSPWKGSGRTLPVASVCDSLEQDIEIMESGLLVVSEENTSEVCRQTQDASLLG